MENEVDREINKMTFDFVCDNVNYDSVPYNYYDEDAGYQKLYKKYKVVNVYLNINKIKLLNVIIISYSLNFLIYLYNTVNYYNLR